MSLIKTYLTADELLHKSYQLALTILNSGFRPNFMVAIWRGGTPVGIAVQELMEYAGVSTDHIAIRTSYYNSHKGVDHKRKKVRVHNLGYFIDKICDNHKLLIVDDVFDTGKSIEALLETIHKKARKNAPKEIKIATVYYKPSKSQASIVPDYYIEQTEDWLVFPHELCGLQKAELQQHKPEIYRILESLKSS